MSGVDKYRTSSGTFRAPTIPKTPSKTINSMLETRCGKEHTNIGKTVLAYYICGVFQAITTLYNAVNQDKKKHSHTLWMVSCGVVSAVIVLKAYLVYNIIMASAFIVHTLFYYGAIGLGLFGAGLGVSGAIFFDKDGSGPVQGHTAGYGGASVSERAKQYSENVKYD